jgi:hypothetical protein
MTEPRSLTARNVESIRGPSGVGQPLNRISLLIVNIGDHARAFVLA